MTICDPPRNTCRQCDKSRRRRRCPGGCPTPWRARGVSARPAPAPWPGRGRARDRGAEAKDDLLPSRLGHCSSNPWHARRPPATPSGAPSQLAARLVLA